ncbi:cell division protein FtsX [Bacteroidetes bacterium SCGC AAA795-G10]|nr:cell division protein FtsX [Bacteroidetes bacterium SCGC AAA795-G10]
MNVSKKNQEKFQNRRVLNSYFSVIISITFVLFLLGILGLFVLNYRSITSHFKEQIAMNVYLKNNAKEIEITQLQKKILLNPATKKLNYISKEEAAKSYVSEIGEDFINFLGYNPLLDVIDVFFNASYVNNQTLSSTKIDIESFDFVDEVVYDKPLLELLEVNIRKITFGLLFFTLFFVIIALLLINSSIRLSIFSKRFIIKTMQLVGAKKSFIRKPFILNNMLLGFISSLISLGALSYLIFEIDRQFPELKIFNQTNELVIIYLIVMMFGIIISGLSTFFATQRYLNLKTNTNY